MNETGLLLMDRRVLILFIFYCWSVLSAASSIDSLETKLKSTNGKDLVNTLCDLCWEYRFVSGDTALAYGERALSLANEIGYQKGIAQAYNDMGIIYVDRGSFPEALVYFENSMVIRRSINDSSGIASLYNKIGIVYQKQGKLKQSLYNAIEALKIYESLKQELWIGYCLNNIAIINYNMGDLSTSLNYHGRALSYRKKLGDLYGEAGSYSNIANVLLELGDTLSAIANYEQALTITRQIKHEESTAVMLTNLGAVYLSLGEYKKAEIFLKESLSIREDLEDQKAIASTMLKLGMVYTNLKLYQQAKEYLYTGLRIARSIDVIDEEMQAYLEIAKWHAIQNKMDSAFVYLDYYSTTKDSVYSQRLEQQIVDAQTKYDTERKEQELVLLTKENKLKEISLDQRRTELLLLLFIIISLVGAGIFLYYRRKQKQKIALDMALIQHTEQQVKAVLEGQEEERRRIARELHDGVGQSLSGVKLQWESISPTIKSDALREKLSSLSNLIDGAANEVRTISHQMMPKELEQFGLVAAIKGIINISENSSSMKCSFNYLNLDSRLDNVIELGLFRVTQELMSNIQKHSEATEVNIQLLKRAENVVLMVEDNGKGFDYEQIKGIGIGLLNIESRVNNLGGILNVESNIGSGTIVTIRIPLL